ncbi:MAG: 50S ribosomal protein L4 [Clostridia bacterium]|nr:50S ribosomal protein L4 [Clostridia bacterium]MBR2926285.1 50S ribosomal protein L4 [Clostridia bacterium]
MPVVKILNMSGNEVGELALNDKLFGAEVNGAVLHAAVRAYLMNQRQGTQSTLTRSEVSGGGRKPWRQKGTGRARQGSTRSPQWTHGGIALGPKPRDYRLAMNKKTRRVALFSALSDKVASGNLVVVDNITLEGNKPSTKILVGMFKAFGFEKTYTKTYKTVTVEDGAPVYGTATKEAVKAQKTLVVLDSVDTAVIKSCANIPTVKTTQCTTLSVYDVLNAEKLVLTVEAVKKLEEVYA